MEILKFYFATHAIGKLSAFAPDITTVKSALDQISTVLARHFQENTRSLLATHNPLDKCHDCVWFHKSAKFCAVAPNNLASIECADRQLPEQPSNLDYLEARSPERIALIQDLAQNIGVASEVLEEKLFQGWAKHHESFGLTTRGLLTDIENISGFSIAQMELIGDGIRVNMDDTVPAMIASAIRKKISAGRDFNYIMRWLLVVAEN